MRKTININFGQTYIDVGRYPHVKGIASFKILNSNSSIDSISQYELDAIFVYLENTYLFSSKPDFNKTKTIDIGSKYLNCSKNPNLAFSLVLNTELYNSLKFYPKPNNTIRIQQFIQDFKHEVYKYYNLNLITVDEISKEISHKIISQEEQIAFPQHNLVLGASDQDFLGELIKKDYHNIFSKHLNIVKFIQDIENHKSSNSEEYRQLQYFLEHPDNITYLISKIENSKYITQLRQQEFLSTRVSLDEANNYFKSKNPYHNEIVEPKEYIKLLNSLPEQDLESFFNTFNYKLKIPQSSTSGDIVSKPKFR